jgi:hypothetical protein
MVAELQAGASLGQTVEIAFLTTWVQTPSITAAILIICRAQIPGKGTQTSISQKGVTNNGGDVF